MNFDEYWAIGIQANPLLGSSDVLRAIAEAAWNAGAREEREECATKAHYRGVLASQLGQAQAEACAKDIYDEIVGRSNV